MLFSIPGKFRFRFETRLNGLDDRRQGVIDPLALIGTDEAAKQALKTWMLGA